MNNSEPDPQLKDQEDSNARSKQRGRGKKRKRPTSTSSTDEETVLPDNTLEVEKNLHASAIKNNLDDASVKKILKKVVTNDHVLALVKLREEEEDSSTEESLRPKLTRAKAKELMKASPKSVPWNLELTPIKHIPVKTRPEVKALIAQELPDDEDDDEYEPTHDDVPSDDEHMLESSSDVDSLPRTPGTPRNPRKSSTPNVVNDGPFKVPQDLSTVARRKLVLEEEEATIALRTRSKLSLSATSIEHIESSFVPPDELPSADVDSLWNDFLNDCLNPASNARNEDDDETDPEYSVAADPDADEEDEESLENSIIKISKKELNDLMTELFSIVPDGTTEQLAENMMQEVLTEHSRPEQHPSWEGKQEPLSDEENNTELRRSSISMPAPITVKRDSTTIVVVGKSEPQDEQDIENTEVNKQCSHYVNTKENERIDSNKKMVDKIQAEILEDTRQISNENELNQQAKERAPHPNVKINNNGENGETYPSVLRTVLSETQETVRVELPKEDVVRPEQRAILAQQLRQHVQLAAGSFLQLYAHPEHWARAPQYKDFLMTLHKIGEQNAASIVNVCNLKPAVELITCWEASVSDNSPENIKMVEFVVQEVEKSRRRIAQNALYVGNFPEMYMKVVANSNVFLYPYLLPSMPYRPDNLSRKFTYLRSEDELLALGLAQFWEYVLANPSMYKFPSRPHPRHRWGLAATARLITKHMVPWLTPKMIIAHISLCRKVGDESNPIVKFFKTMTVEPVKHTLLPFDPRRTLYDQLEMDMPRIWLRYLSKNVQTKHLFKRKNENLCKAPAGVDLNVAMHSGPTKKVALSADFTKEIISNRLNQLPPKTSATEQPAPKITIIQPNVYTVIRTSIGSYLIPLQLQTMTVNSSNTPICTPALATNAVSENKNTENASAAKGNLGTAVNKATNVQISSGDHCQCCVLLRKTRRCKQKRIFDYFKSSKESRKCECNGKRYPKITKRLKLLVNNYKVNTESIHDDLKMKVLTLKQEMQGGSEMISANVPASDDNVDNDYAVAILFQLKLTVRSSVIRDNYIKRRIHTLFSKFDPNYGNVLELAKSLEKICNVDLVEMYREFIGFLTPEQADELGQFKDYFVQRCETKMIDKIEALVLDKQKRIDLLNYLKLSLHTNYYLKWSSCAICTDLLKHMTGYPDLMEYVFSLFPHRRIQSPEQQESASKNVSEPPTSSHIATQDNNILSLKEQESATTNGAIRECTVSNSMDYEADHSSSDEDIEIKDNPKNEEEEIEVQKDFELKQEVDLDVLNISIRKARNSDSSETSMVLVSDEDPLKTEAPDWKREEDKTILEILKQHIKPEERKDITILDIIKDTPIIQMITESLSHKSIEEIKKRILYLLQLLVGEHTSEHCSDHTSQIVKEEVTSG